MMLLSSVSSYSLTRVMMLLSSVSSSSFLTLIVYWMTSPSLETLSVKLMEYRGTGGPPSSEGSIAGRGEEDGERPGESGPSVEELLSASNSSDTLSDSIIFQT